DSFRLGTICSVFIDPGASNEMVFVVASETSPPFPAQHISLVSPAIECRSRMNSRGVSTVKKRIVFFIGREDGHRSGIDSVVVMGERVG
ncbi:hypothetical protein BHE74_00057530, partial [Ensete ventricosum]